VPVAVETLKKIIFLVCKKKIKNLWSYIIIMSGNMLISDIQEEKKKRNNCLSYTYIIFSKKPLTIKNNYPFLQVFIFNLLEQ